MILFFALISLDRKKRVFEFLLQKWDAFDEYRVEYAFCPRKMEHGRIEISIGREVSPFVFSWSWPDDSIFDE